MDSSVARGRQFFLLVVLCLIATSATAPLIRWARAQDEPAKSGPAPAAEPAGPEAAAAGADKAAADKPAVKSAAPSEDLGSPIWWVIKTSGLIGGVILLLSIYFVRTVILLFLQMRQQVAAPPELTDELMELLQKRDFKEIYTVVKEDSSFVSRLLTTGIAELPNGLAEARDAMERVGEAVTVEMERKISMLAVLGTLGPMIGLLGTLKGMIASFGVIARSDVQLKTSEVANSISEALLLTFEGVALSVPAIYFFAVFRNRVSSISVATLLEADEFLRHFAHAVRSKAAPAAAAGAAAAPPPAKPTKP